LRGERDRDLLQGVGDGVEASVPPVHGQCSAPVQSGQDHRRASAFRGGIMGGLCMHNRVPVLEGYGGSDRGYADFHEKASLVKADVAAATTVRFGYPCHASIRTL
jgi:hypothetical protein